MDQPRRYHHHGPTMPLNPSSYCLSSDLENLTTGGSPTTMLNLDSRNHRLNNQTANKQSTNSSNSTNSLKRHSTNYHIPTQTSITSTKLKSIDHLPNAIDFQHQSQLLGKLFTSLYVLAIIIIVLYISYAAYLYHQHQIHRRDLTSATSTSPSSTSTSSHVSAIGPNGEELHQARSSGAESLVASGKSTENQQLLDEKIHLLERYIEVIALDLAETKNRLKEREKCDCSQSCLLNGTRYADRSSWQSQCDVCTCQSGVVSCLPMKCPQLNCDDPVQVVGQCCPSCMRKCRHNNKILKHGQRFSPSLLEPNKECRCYDGLIKCEQPVGIHREDLNHTLSEAANKSFVVGAKLETEANKLRTSVASKLMPAGRKTLTNPTGKQSP